MPDKKCKDCGQVKPVDEFYRSKAGSLYSRCKACHYVRTRARLELPGVRERLNQLDRERYAAKPFGARFKHLRKKYGLTEQAYNDLLASQGGVCAVCLKGFAPESGTDMYSPVVDHDHDSGAVRGILHRRCNLALEFLLTDTELRRALAYLARGSRHVSRIA
jgi:hypothetical protein